jgi:hypothetical protein
MAGNMTTVLVAFTLVMGAIEGVMTFLGWALSHYADVGG